MELLEASERAYSSEFLPHTVTFNFLHSANEVTCRSCKFCLRFFLLSGLQAAVAPDVTGIADRGLVLARIPNEGGESPSKGFHHPEAAQSKVLAVSSLGTALSVLL